MAIEHIITLRELKRRLGRGRTLRCIHLRADSKLGASRDDE
jgi:hypothetical protein